MWIIVIVENRSVKRVSEEIGGFVPVLERWTRPHGKRKPVISRVPVFPGWVFREWDDYFYHRGWRSVIGVRGIMRQRDKGPMLLKESDIERLEAIQEELKMPELVEESTGWAPEVGDEVEIRGLVDDLIGVVLTVDHGYASLDVGGNFPIKTRVELLRQRTC